MSPRRQGTPLLPVPGVQSRWLSSQLPAAQPGLRHPQLEDTWGQTNDGPSGLGGDAESKR